MNATHRRGRKGAIALLGAGATSVAAVIAGVPLWLCAAPLLVVAAVLLLGLRRSGRLAGATQRNDDGDARAAVLHRLQPLSPRAATTPQSQTPRPMLWEHPTPRARRI